MVGHCGCSAGITVGGTSAAAGGGVEKMASRTAGMSHARTSEETKGNLYRRISESVADGISTTYVTSLARVSG